MFSSLNISLFSIFSLSIIEVVMFSTKKKKKKKNEKRKKRKLNKSLIKGRGQVCCTTIKNFDRGIESSQIIYPNLREFE